MTALIGKGCLHFQACSTQLAPRFTLAVGAVYISFQPADRSIIVHAYRQIQPFILKALKIFHFSFQNKLMLTHLI